MSCKLTLNNGAKPNGDGGIGAQQQWIKATSIDSSVKLAGEEAKDRLYEPKHKKKLVRVLTVVAYVFFVSLAAIMLSLYYVFLWNGNQKVGQTHNHLVHQPHNAACNQAVPYDPTPIPLEAATTPSTTFTTDYTEEEEIPLDKPTRNYTDNIYDNKIYNSNNRNSRLLNKLISQTLLN